MNAQIRDVALSILREFPSIDLRNGSSGEEQWCAILGERLNQISRVSAVASRSKSNYYPGTRQTIDLLVRLEDNSQLWLECKGAWKACFGDSGRPNPAYRKHLLSDDPKEHSCLSDIRHKLTRISTPGDFIGELLIGFDSVHRPMDADIAELMEVAGLNRYPWEGYHLRWANPNDHDHSFGCWLWLRPAVVPKLGKVE
jgi:hypothetical protein